MDNLTSLIDERDREVQNIVASINELAQVGQGGRHSTGGLWVLRGATGTEREWSQWRGSSCKHTGT